MRAAKTPTKRAAATPAKKHTAIPDASSEDRSAPARSDTPLAETASAVFSVTEVDGILVVDSMGDVVLKIEHEKQSISLRATSTVLKSQSKYFDRLLRSGRFGEAQKVSDTHRALREKYGVPSEAPAIELPTLEIQDLGRISNVKAVDALLTDFFLILHGRDLPMAPPVGNLGNLAIVADRFDALDAFRAHVRRRKTIRALDGRTTPKLEAALTEEKVRQRLLIATLLDYPPWMEKYSARLIGKGWVGKETNVNAPLWWDLPSRVEEELAFRRECVLETIQSVQSYFLSLYTSRERQCKLGYDSSAQCDSFQLGEMVRFFSRVGTLQLKGVLVDSAECATEPYEGDLLTLLDSLRHVPEYQIDRFHSHCGIRTRLIPILDLLQECLQSIGICGECWQNDRTGHAWIEAKKPLLWQRSTFRPRSQSCAAKHAALRELFSAAERDWSS